MKKLIPALALSLVLGLSTVSFADDGETTQGGKLSAPVGGETTQGGSAEPLSYAQYFAQLVGFSTSDAGK